MGCSGNVYRQAAIQVNSMSKIILTTFTDPMMGLTYECEPIYDKLKKKYQDNIEFRFVMAGLVRDVSDFMNEYELSLSTEKGIEEYCKRLVGIYKSEEKIGGLPMNMDNFHLFDADHRSSYPLNIAYKAAQLAAPELAEQFLIKLRHATVLEGRQTTLISELYAIAEETGIEKDAFEKVYSDGSAEKAFDEDLIYTRSLGIYSLPAYIIESGDTKYMIKQLASYETIVGAIDLISNS